MSDNSYAAPKSDLTRSGSIDASILIEPLAATKPWVRFLSILGFIFAGFMVLAGVIVMLGGMAASSALGDEAAGTGIAGTFLGVFYIVFSLMYFFPSLFLFKYASAIGRAIDSHSSDDIADALVSQKSFWKFAGIMGIVMIVLMVLGIFVGFFSAAAMFAGAGI